MRNGDETGASYFPHSEFRIHHSSDIYNKRRLESAGDLFDPQLVVGYRFDFAMEAASFGVDGGGSTRHRQTVLVEGDRVHGHESPPIALEKDQQFREEVPQKHRLVVTGKVPLDRLRIRRGHNLADRRVEPLHGRHHQLLHRRRPNAHSHVSRVIEKLVGCLHARKYTVSMRKPVIGVMGGSKAGEGVYAMAKELGALIASRGWVLLNGGRNAGVMAASAEGAKQAGGTVIGILPDRTDAQASPHLDFAIMTDMGDGRNLLNVLSSDVVIACPGKLGTLSEIVLALKHDKPVILLGFELTDPPFAKFVKEGRLTSASTPQEAVDLAAKALATRSA